MSFEGKKNTDRWFPVRMTDSVDLVTAETAITSGTTAITYGFEAATGGTVYADAAADWKEQGLGNYWLRMGAGEFASEGKYLVNVAATGCATYTFCVEVGDKNLADIGDDVILAHTDASAANTAAAAARADASAAYTAAAAAHTDASAALTAANAAHGDASTTVTRLTANRATLLDTLSNGVTLSAATHIALESAMRSGGRVWFVTKVGNDSTGDGTAKLPYLTIGKANTVRAAGDIIVIGPGTFAEAADISATPGTFIGSGIGRTIISCNTAGTTFVMGASSTLLDMTILQTDSTFGNFALGGSGANTRVERVRAASASPDGITFINGTGVFLDCIFESEDDAVLAGSAVTDDYRFIRCREEAISAVSGHSGIVIGGGVVVALDCNCYIDAHNDIVPVAGYLINAGTLFLQGGTITTANSGTEGAKDIEVGIGQTCYVCGTTYSAAKVSGTITHVEPGASILTAANATHTDASAGLTAATSAQTTAAGAASNALTAAGNASAANVTADLAHADASASVTRATSASGNASNAHTAATAAHVDASAAYAAAASIMFDASAAVTAALGAASNAVTATTAAVAAGAEATAVRADTSQLLTDAVVVRAFTAGNFTGPVSGAGSHIFTHYASDGTTVVATSTITATGRTVT